MKTLFRPALSLFILLSVFTGLVYPALVFVLGQTFFAQAANGSLVARDGKIVGSTLIGQNFAAPEHFWGRPSATSPQPYNGLASGGSNLGPANPALQDAIKARIAALHAADPGNTAAIPVDLVTASGSGLDPDISPAAALYQLPRVARAHGLPEQRVRDLIVLHTVERTAGVLGEARVNVLGLNLALDALAK